MADTVSVTQAVLLRAFKLVDGIAGEINGVPNEPTDDMADDIAMDLAEALGVPFDEHWPEAAAAALASTQPAPAFPREEVDEAALVKKALSIATYGQPAQIAVQVATNAVRVTVAALLQGKHP